MSTPLEFARQTARQAGHLLRELYHRRHEVRFKSSDIDLVTEADLASEQLILEAIRSRFPEHAILTEESGGDLPAAAPNVPYLWLVDPLDGTVNYAHGFPFWGVSLALLEKGEISLGVIYDPLRDELFWAEQGKGAWGNNQPLRVSSASRLREALVATGFAYRRATIRDNNLAEFSALMPQVQGVRRAGAAVLDLAYIAAGRLDAYWEMHLHPWDWGAGVLMVQEAGGQVSDLDGRPWSLETKGLLASNGPLHQSLRALLREARQR